MARVQEKVYYRYDHMFLRQRAIILFAQRVPIKHLLQNNNTIIYLLALPLILQ